MDNLSAAILAYATSCGYEKVTTAVEFDNSRSPCMKLTAYGDSIKLSAIFIHHTVKSDSQCVITFVEKKGNNDVHNNTLSFDIGDTYSVLTGMRTLIEKALLNFDAVGYAITGQRIGRSHWTPDVPVPVPHITAPQPPVPPKPYNAGNQPPAHDWDAPTRIVDHAEPLGKNPPVADAYIQVCGRANAVSEAIIGELRLDDQGIVSGYGTGDIKLSNAENLSVISGRHSAGEKSE